MGAVNPQDFGGYYAWGKTEVKERTQGAATANIKEAYSWATYKYAEGNWDKLTKYCYDSEKGRDGFTDGLKELELTDDAVHANWGGKWRLPTMKEFQALRDSCEWTLCKRKGVKGFVVEGPNGGRIFLPAAGLYLDWSEDLKYEGGAGNYWTRSLSSTSPDGACSWVFATEYNSNGGSEDLRCCGLSVRGVFKK